jgi:competence protein ComEC
LAKIKNGKQQPPKDPFNIFGKTWIILLCLLIFAPAGIYLLWKNKKFDPFIRVVLSALFGLVFIYNSWYWFSPDSEPKPSPTPSAQTSPASSTPAVNLPSNQQASPAQPQEYIPPVLPSPDFSSNRLLKVHFLDVGQADSIVIQTPEDKTLLIDGGNRDDSDFLMTYLKNLGVNELYAVIATHPHEDHIGGLQEIMNSIPVKNFYMPEVSHTTKTFEALVQAVEKSGAQKIAAKVGKSIPLDELHLSMVFLAPNSSKYEELNNYSAVLKLAYNNISFLFTGDAEELSEKEMLDYNRNINATVLKVGHHGSRKSSSLDFLKAVKPTYAVISCGQDNEYGYPHSESIENLNKVGTNILRTDVLGTLVIETDGEKLGINKVLNP